MATKMNPWVPIKDPKVQRRFGKTLEELGELTSAVSRCLIQGIDECEPVTGKPNRQWLLEELADVEVQTLRILRMLQMSPQENNLYEERLRRKNHQMEEWENFFKDEPCETPHRPV